MPGNRELLVSGIPGNRELLVSGIPGNRELPVSGIPGNRELVVSRTPTSPNTFTGGKIPGVQDTGNRELPGSRIPGNCKLPDIRDTGKSFLGFLNAHGFFLTSSHCYRLYQQSIKTQCESNIYFINPFVPV